MAAKQLFTLCKRMRLRFRVGTSPGQRLFAFAQLPGLSSDRFAG
jgi:hypothetical protein